VTPIGAKSNASLSAALLLLVERYTCPFVGRKVVRTYNAAMILVSSARLLVFAGMP
jgi:hypothetical protein